MSSHPAFLPIALSVALLFPAGLHAQAEQTPEKLLDGPPTETPAEADEAGPATGDTPASSEVDFNEDNFRRSMELRDEALQRSPDLTTGSYSRGTGIESLDALPEASQKHLREQLREVIVESGPWTPDEAGEVYPYVPSAEAMENGSLEKKEQAAWSELIAKYHEREASMHANGARGQSEAADGMESAGGEQHNVGAALRPRPGSESGQDDGRAPRAAALAELLESGGTVGSESAAGSAPPTDQGVSQNALELLTERRQLPAAAAAEAGEGERGDSGLDLDSEGVIAIEDLQKVRLDPEAAEKN